MLTRVPDYYEAFHCLAGACPHTCCEKWEVVVDEETARRYQETPGSLGERLREALPQAEVSAVYDGAFFRRPARPIVCVGLLSETMTDGAGSAKLGVWLYTAAGDSAAPLFAAVVYGAQCGARRDEI